MKNFEFTRFCRVVKWDFARGRRHLLWGMVSMVLAYLLLFFVAHMTQFHYNVEKTPAEIMRGTMEAFAGFAVIALSIYLLVCISTIFTNEQTKQGRTTTLMLPATNAEKFWSHWLYVMTFTVLGSLLMLPVADALHMAYCAIRGDVVMSATTMFFQKLMSVVTLNYATLDHAREWNLLTVSLAAASVTNLLFYHAVFLLGGVFFRKQHFLATCLVLVIVASILLWLGTHISWQPSKVFFHTSQSYWKTFVIDALFNLACTVAFYWGAFRLFCRYQLDNRKFVNL